MADVDLTQAVQAVLDDDENLRSYGLRAQSNGKTVTVVGVVDVLAEKRYVESIVQAIPGVEKVESAIAISTDGQITDADVRFEVGEELGLYPADELRQLSIRANGGVVTLIGEVSREEFKAQALEAAAKARGVVEVVNKIKVRD